MRGSSIAAPLLAAGLAWACAFRPAPPGEVPFRERAESKTIGGVTVSAVVLGEDETRAVLGAPLERSGVQPVWLRIRNAEDHDYYLLVNELDPDYFSPFEASWKNHLFLGGAENEKMDDHLHDRSMSLTIPAGGTEEGFVYTNLERGAKFVSVELIGGTEVREFNFLIDVPGLRVDYERVDFDALYAPREVRDVELDELRAELEELPCCALGGDRRTPGDPLNLVVIADRGHILAPFVQRGWHLTEAIHASSVWGTVRSSLFRSEYRYSPLSSLYLFERPQDFALQKARRTVDERNHLRLWLSPLRLDGKEVWVGQISRDVGLRLNRRTLITHKIDPQVDEARNNLVVDLALSQNLGAFAFVKGVGAATRAEPRRNYTGDSYFTDGLRVVLFLTDEPVSLLEIEALDWEEPPTHWD